MTPPLKLKCIGLTFKLVFDRGECGSVDLTFPVDCNRPNGSATCFSFSSVACGTAGSAGAGFSTSISVGCALLEGPTQGTKTWNSLEKSEAFALLLPLALVFFDELFVLLWSSFAVDEAVCASSDTDLVSFCRVDGLRA